MPYYRDLHEWLDALESRELLNRVRRPINKDTEMQPLVRLQLRGLEEKDRRGWLFEKDKCQYLDVTSSGFRRSVNTLMSSVEPHLFEYVVHLVRYWISQWFSFHQATRADLLDIPFVLVTNRLVASTYWHLPDTEVLTLVL